ncbi:MAG: lipopolysaccharide kinase InaA family protein [Syntrophorhabdaceae bacterium]
MAKFKRASIDGYTFVHRDSVSDIRSFINRAMNPDRRLAAGRGGPGLFQFDGKDFVCRQYLHGGWLRGITGGSFTGEKRAADELDITVYLEDHGFPVIRAIGYIVRKKVITKDLFFVSVFRNETQDLVEYFRSADARNRLRMARKLGFYFFKLAEIGIYHPDLHLRNVLVNTAGRLFFLDFDKATRKNTHPDDYERMFWRLDRYVRKYASDFGRPVNDRERLIFLRTFERLSGQKIIPRMQKNRSKKEQSARFGWFIDRLFYGKK